MRGGGEGECESEGERGECEGEGERDRIMSFSLLTLGAHAQRGLR